MTLVHLHTPNQTCNRRSVHARFGVIPLSSAIVPKDSEDQQMLEIRTSCDWRFWREQKLPPRAHIKFFYKKMVTTRQELF